MTDNRIERVSWFGVRKRLKFHESFCDNDRNKSTKKLFPRLFRENIVPIYAHNSYIVVKCLKILFNILVEAPAKF